MANINKIQLSGNVYDIEDVNATKTIELTQAEYDALAEIDPNAFYVISDAEGVDLSNYYTKTEVDSALSGKQETLVSGTNIKTINNTSILGSGNIDIQGGGGSVTVDSELSTTSENPVQNKVITNALSDKAQMIELTQAEYNALVDKDPDTLYAITDAPTIDMSNYYSKDETDDLLDEKQETLVSGTNIKTINNTSILGSGNINIQGGGSSYTAGDGIDITNDVISVTGKADTSTVTSLNNALTAHTANTNVHVTAAEKETWNNKSDFSGDYNDLTNKPTIPVVPTNVSAFNNDSGYITSNAISGKADTTAVTQVNNALTAHTANTTVHVTTSEKNSWNNKSNFSGSYDDLTNKPTIPVVPTNVSDFTNDASYITIDAISGKADTSTVTSLNNIVTAHTANTSVHVTAAEKSTWNAKSDFSGSYNDLSDKPTIPVVPTNVSAFNNDSGYITSNAISGKADTSTVTSLNNALTAHTANTNVHVTAANKNAWNAKLDASDVENFFGAVNYDSQTKRINFYNTSTGGTVLGYVDATDFIKDGMVSNVEIKTITSGGSQVEVIAITFNADAGKEEIDIPLTDVFDPNNYYTKSEVNNLIPTVPTSNTAFTNDAQYATSGYVDSAVSGKADTTAFTAHTTNTTIHTTSAEKTSWNGAVTDVATVSASTAANTTALGGLKLVKLTQAEYDALATKDSSTVYFING